MIHEKSARLDIELEDLPTKSSEVFYNKKMEVNRDISVASLEAFSGLAEKRLTIAEVLSGSGIRGIRYLKEIQNIEKAFLNDINPKAVKNICENLKINQIPKKSVQMTNKDAKILLLENRHTFDFIDIDPFGSPIFYIDSTANSFTKFSSLGVTATDLAVLAGAYKKTCMRRYFSTPLKTEYCHEIGLRILIKAIFEILARHDLSFEPLLCFYDRHYYRIFGKVLETAKRANQNFQNIGFLSHCFKCLYRKLDAEKIVGCPNCQNKLSCAGPLWIGHFSDKRFAEKVLKNLKKRKWEKAKNLVEIIHNETGINIPFYDLHVLAKMKKLTIGKRSEIIEKIQKIGYFCERTHFSPLGIRTNCPIDQVYGVLK